eukprot:m.12973 g.12973  ORF g.12973 m.12973 type:complete len:89 (-) comp4606_c0_seq2:256-522(-)
MLNDPRATKFEKVLDRELSPTPTPTLPHRHTATLSGKLSVPATLARPKLPAFQVPYDHIPKLLQCITHVQVRTPRKLRPNAMPRSQDR